MAIERDPRFGEVEPERLGIGARRLDRARRREAIERIERRPRRIGRPFGRFHPRDPPAFLVDAHQQLLAPVERAQLVGQRAKLRAGIDIAAEEDVARRIALAKERLLFGGKRFPAESENGRCHDRETRSKARVRQAAMPGACGKFRARTVPGRWPPRLRA